MPRTKAQVRIETSKGGVSVQLIERPVCAVCGRRNTVHIQFNHGPWSCWRPSHIRKVSAS